MSHKQQWRGQKVLFLLYLIMVYKRTQPYNQLPPLPPSRKILDSPEILKKLAGARASLAELKGRSPVIPNPMMLINTLVLQEAMDSSTIENIVTSQDKLYKAFSSANNKTDPHTKEVLRYREALWKAFKNLQDKRVIKQGLLIDIFRTITGKNEGIRDKQVYVGNQFQTVYTPPAPGKMLKEKMADWINYANNKDEPDALIRMALLHYQFESIHPFSDGNGRTGRILNVLFLTMNNLLDLPVLYLSRYILEYKSDYYRLLREVTEENNWKDWILFILQAVEQTAGFTVKKINAINDLFQDTLNLIRGKAGDIYSYELVETLFHQPYCRIGILVELNIASRNTASKYLNRLAEIEVLEKQKEGNEFLFLNTGLYQLLSRSE